MTTYNDYICIPELNTTTAVSGAPKMAGEAWFAFQALQWDAANRYWKAQYTGPGWAYADGAAASGATTGNIQVRPFLCVPRLRPIKSAVRQFLRVVQKIVGVAWSTGAAIYRDGDPSSATFMQHSTASSGRQFIGAAAVSAAAGDSIGIVKITVYPLITKTQVTGDFTEADGLVYIPDEVRVVTKPGGSGTWTNTFPTYRDHDGSYTQDATTGGRGKTLVGMGLGAAASGAVPGAYAPYLQTHEWDAALQFLMETSAGTCLLTSRTTAESSVVTSSEYASLKVGAVYGLSGASVTEDAYYVLIYCLFDASNSGQLISTQTYGPDFCIDFPYSQLSGSVAPYVPSDLVIVYNGILDLAYYWPAVVTENIPSGYVQNNEVRILTKYQGRTGEDAQASDYSYIYKHPTDGLRTSAYRQCNEAMSPNTFRNMAVWQPYVKTVEDATFGPATTACSIDVTRLNYDGSSAGVTNYPLTQIATDTSGGYRYRLWSGIFTNPGLSDWTLGETHSENPVTVGGLGWSSRGWHTHNIGKFTWPWSIPRINGGGSYRALSGSVPDGAAPPTAPTLTITPTITLTTVGVDTQIEIDVAQSAALGAFPNRGTSVQFMPFIGIQRPSDGRWLNLNHFQSMHYLQEKLTNLSQTSTTSTDRFRFFLRNTGPAPLPLVGTLWVRCRVNEIARGASGTWIIQRVDLGTITIPVT